MKQFWFLRQTNQRRLTWIIPFVAGSIMLLASVLPWLRDGLQGNRIAWNIPVNIGWEVQTSLGNYGLLCMGCACYTFLIAYAHWRPFRGSAYFMQKQGMAGLLCLVPVFLFLFQYLLADTVQIDTLARHLIQSQLIERHFGYDYPVQLLRIDPFVFDTSTIGDRVRLLIDSSSIGVLLPLISAWMLIDYKRFFMQFPQPILSKRPKRYIRCILIGAIICACILLGRAPFARLAGYQAKAALTTGNYTKALQWLDLAHAFNPALDQVYYYHVERGEASYFLYPQLQTDDTHAYLAFNYAQQGDNLDAYQEILAVWRQHSTTPWIVNEMSYALEKLSEFAQPLKGVQQRRPINDDTALPWLELLIQVDSSTVYGHYVEGRIQYDLRNYSECMKQMAIVIHTSSVAEIQSSAYTYIALSYAGQGNFLQERTLLLKAVALDPNYENNTAREELSGLR